MGLSRREFVAEAGGRARARFSNLQETGIHHVDVLRNGWAQEQGLELAVNASLAESDFTPVAPERIAEALGGQTRGSAVAVRLDAGTQSESLARRGGATYLLLALAFLFVGEGLLASRG